MSLKLCLIYFAQRLLTDAVSSDTVSYMERGVAGREFNYLSQDPSFAQDFAPNGESRLRAL